MVNTLKIKTVEALLKESHANADPASQLEEAYRLHGKRLYRFALSITGRAEDAEDAVQDVFARIAASGSLEKAIRDPQKYLFRSVRNASYQLLKRRQKTGELSDFEAAATASEPELALDVVRAFSELPPEQREVITLKAYDQLTFAEIARALGISQNTAASRYRYGIERMRQSLESINNG